MTAPILIKCSFVQFCTCDHVLLTMDLPVRLKLVFDNYKKRHAAQLQRGRQAAAQVELPKAAPPRPMLRRKKDSKLNVEATITLELSHVYKLTCAAEVHDATQFFRGSDSDRFNSKVPFKDVVEIIDSQEAASSLCYCASGRRSAAPLLE